MCATPPEFNIVTSPIPVGLSVIEASAGTGKTYAISHLVARLLLENRVSRLSEILLVTFTNAAARELSDRVRKVLVTLAKEARPDEAQTHPVLHGLRSLEHSQKTIRNALLDLDQLGVSTIHSFCQRTLQSEGTLCGLPAMPDLIMDAEKEIELALYDLWQSTLATDEFLSAIASSQRWELEQDIHFVKTTLALDAYAPVPPAQDFQKAAASLQSMAVASKDVDDLEKFLPAVGKWKKSGADASARAAHIAALRNPNGSLAHADFRQAVAWIADIPSHINLQSQAGKDQAKLAKELPIVATCKDCLNQIALLRWHWQNHCLASLQKTVASALQSKRQITQDGLIGTLRDALVTSHTKETLIAQLRARYKVALIDESQDTDPRQFEIFKSLFMGSEQHRLILIGDPKQAIYSFRGADVNTYLTAKTEAKSISTLTKTFRASQALVDAVNGLFSRPNALLNARMTYPAAVSGLSEYQELIVSGVKVPPLQAWIVPDDQKNDYKNATKRNKEITGRVASEIVRLLQDATLQTARDPSALPATDHPAPEQRPVLPGDIAILVRRHAEALLMAAALQSRGVRCVVNSGADILATDEAQEILRLLRAVDNPRRKQLRYSALATRMLGKAISELHAIQQDASLDEKWLDQFSAWHGQWAKGGIASLLASIDQSELITQRLSSLERGERRVTNFRQLSDLLQAASQTHSPRPSQLLRWYAQEITRSEDRVHADERQIQLESDAAAVQVMTMHKAKGLEYDLVFCPFLWTAKDPAAVQVLRKSRPESNDRIVDVNLAKENTTLVAELQRTRLEEDLRLAYVGLTRARVAAWIYGGAVKAEGGRSALDWLLRNDTLPPFEEWQASQDDPAPGTTHAEGLRQITPSPISPQPPPEPSRTSYIPATNTDATPLAALPAPTVPTAWTITSFSSLTRESHPHGGSDQPALHLPGEPEPPTPAAHPTPFLEAPRGKAVGTAVHDWMEGWDFSEPHPEAIHRHLSRYAFPPQDNFTPLATSLPPLLAALRLARLPAMRCTLADACSRPESSEWLFHLPLKPKFSTAHLADVFAANGQADYARALRDLSSDELQGFLQGFMDRLACHQGQWGVIDWKTNWLGDHLADYTEEKMMECAFTSHYFLQVHLYLVALRRYLRAFPAHPAPTLCGAYLVFLRGITRTGTGGILSIHPTEPLLDALDALFA